MAQKADPNAGAAGFNLGGSQRTQQRREMFGVSVANEGPGSDGEKGRKGYTYSQSPAGFSDRVWWLLSSIISAIRN